MAGVHSGRNTPDRYEILDVVGVDLIERAVAPTLVVAAGHQPVFRFRIREARVGHRRVVRCKGRAGRARDQQGRKARAGQKASTF